MSTALFSVAGVPEHYWLEALDCLAKARIGYEIDNLWNGTEQAWYPIAGHELRAPLTWSVLPRRGD